jgi:hypothetical protein
MRRKIASAMTIVTMIAMTAGVLRASMPVVLRCAVELAVGTLVDVDVVWVEPPVAVGVLVEVAVSSVVAACLRFVQSSFTPWPFWKYESMDCVGIVCPLHAACASVWSDWREDIHVAEHGLMALKSEGWHPCIVDV